MRILGMISFLGLLAFLSIETAHAGVPCDATTGASMKVVGIAISAAKTTATITWTEGRHNGGRVFQYGINGNYGPLANVQSRANGAKKEVMTGLTPDTLYKYRMYGLWGNNNTKIKDSLTGSFRTDGIGCGDVVYTKVEVTGVVLSNSVPADSLENVTVSIVRTSDGVILGKDFTDRSGGYALAVEPGDYTLKCAYSPFAVLNPYPLKIIAGKSFEVKDQILTGAFQIGGNALTAANGTLIVKAAITVTSKTDVNVVYMRETDTEGHFNFGLKAGEYWLTATYAGKGLAKPYDLKVSKSTEIPDLILSSTVGIKGLSKVEKGMSGSVKEFNVKGARTIKKSNHPVQVYQVIK